MFASEQINLLEVYEKINASMGKYSEVNETVLDDLVASI